MYLPLDGPSLNGALSVTDTSVELKVGATRLEERTVVTIQPLDGNIYFGFSNSVTSANGTLVYKGQFFAFEAGDQEEVWLVADTGVTVDVRIAERC